MEELCDLVLLGSRESVDGLMVHVPVNSVPCVRVPVVAAFDI